MNARKAILGTGAALLLIMALVVYSNLASQRPVGTSKPTDGLGGIPSATDTHQAVGERDSPRPMSNGVTVGPNRDPTHATSVSLAGVMDSALKDRHGLSEEQFLKCQMILSAFWKSGQERIRRNCYFDEGMSTDDLAVYRISAMNESERKMLFNALRGDLEIAGNHRFVEEVVESVSQSDSFAGFGKFDSELRFSKRIITVVDPIANTSEEVVGSGNASVSYSFHDPTTGKLVRETTGADLLSIEPIFGEFKMPGMGEWESLLQDQ